MSKSKPITLGVAIFYGGLMAGILDAADGVVAYYFAAGFNPIQVLQFIASAFMERPLFKREFSGALVGLLAHFFIAFAVAAIYVGAGGLTIKGQKASRTTAVCRVGRKLSPITFCFC